MTVTGPPRSPRPTLPRDREEFEALVKALIEEARQRARRRRSMYAAVAASVALVAVAVLTVLDISLQPQDASLARSTPSLVGTVTSPKIAFITGRRACSVWGGGCPGLDPPRRALSGKLYVVNADGSGLRLVAQKASIAVSPAWSPDGQKLLFQSRGRIYVVNVDGSGLQSLTRSPYGDSGAAWSPDGQRIAFVRLVKVRPAGPGAIDADFEIYVMNADGSGQQNLTRNPAWAVYADPAWSPDGQKIAFQRRLEANNGEIYVMNADGSGAQRLTRNAALDSFHAWSPDGQKIAFQRRLKGGNWRGLKGGNWEIFVMNADGSGQRNLTRKGSHELDAAWSPDGRRIVFRTSRHGKWEIYVMNANGGQRRLTRTAAANESRPSWSPDGRKIAFTREAGGNFELYVMNADGSDQRRLTPNSPVDRWVAYAWSPVLSK